MFKKLVFIIIMLLAATISSAQDEEPARLRIMQLSFIPDVSLTVDIQVDDAVVFQGVSFPFTTPYIELEAGEHTLMTTVVDAEDVTATAGTTIDIEAGGRYLVIVEGDYSKDAVRFVLVDETDAYLTDTASATVLVNLTAAPLDYTIDGTTVLDGIAMEDYGVVNTHRDDDSEFGIVSTETPDDVLDSETFTPLENVVTLAVVRVSSEGDAQVIYHYFSPLTVADYLLSIEGSEPFADAVLAATEAAALGSDDGAITMFQPTGEAIDALGDAVPSDPAELELWVTNHFTSGDIPPYELSRTDTLTMVNGNAVALDFETDSGLWEIEGAPIWWDIRMADGVIYWIDGVIVPE